MEKRILLLFFFAALLMGNIRAEEVVLLHLDATKITGSAVTEMSQATNGYNWITVSDKQWVSENCFAQEITSPEAVTFIGKAIKWGSDSSTELAGKATTPSLNLLANPGEQVKLVVKITAASNKTGTMGITLDGEAVGTITALTDGDGTGGRFGAKYYTFEYLLENGTVNSKIEFIHSKTENGGNLYVQEIKVVKSNKELYSLDCSGFTANASTEMSVGAQPHNWTSSLGKNITSAYCYAQSAPNAALGQCVRLGASAFASVGSFTLDGIAIPQYASIRLSFEVAVTNNKDVRLILKLDGEEFDSVLGSELGTSTWVEYDKRVSGGTLNSSLVFATERTGTGAHHMYIRNLRVIVEPNSFSDNGVNYLYDGTDAILAATNEGNIILPATVSYDATIYNVLVPVSLNRNITSVSYQSDGNMSESTVFENPNCLKYIGSLAKPAGWTTNVVKDGEATSLVLTDGYSFDAPVNFEASSISYNRAFQADKLSTIILPFSCPVPANATVKSFSRDTEGEVFFTNLAAGTQMEANTPYVVIASDANVLFSSNETQEIESAVGSVSKDSYKFTGSYFPLKGSDGTFYISNGTQFMKAGSSATIAPFRAYLTPKGGSNAPQFIIFGDGGDGSTGCNIEEVDNLKIYQSANAVVIEVRVPQAVSIFSVDGRIVYSGMLIEGANTISLASGMYIMDGHKFTVK